MEGQGGAPAGQACGHCRAPLRPTAAFCAHCGNAVRPPAPPRYQPPPVTVAPPSPLSPTAAPTAQPASGVGAILDTIGKHTVLAMIFVLVIGALLSNLLWPLLSWPSKAIADALDTSSCDDGWTCTALETLKRCLLPIVVAFVTVLLRRPIQSRMRKITQRVSPKGRFLVAPMFATLLFSMLYASIQTGTDQSSGIISAKTFPAVIGMLTMLATRLGPALARKAPGFFKARDKAPVVLRLVLALALPLAMSVAFGQGSGSAFNSMQVVIVTTMCTSFLALMPRSGSLARATPSAMTAARGAFLP